MSLTDERVVADLVARADRAMPTMSLDAGTVLAAGRRHRRRRRVAGAAGACLALALVAVGVQALPGGRGGAVPPAAGPTEAQAWQPTAAREVDTALGRAVELTGADLPDADAVLLLPLGVDESSTPNLLSVQVRTVTDGEIGAPVQTVRWPVPTDGARTPALLAAYEDFAATAEADRLVYVVGAVPDWADEASLRLDEAEEDLRRFTSPLLPGAAFYVAVVDTRGAELPQVGAEFRGAHHETGWVVMP